MKRLLYIFAAIGVTITSFLTGFLIQQPKVNKLETRLKALEMQSEEKSLDEIASETGAYAGYW
jgi:hypothetical protein